MHGDWPIIWNLPSIRINTPHSHTVAVFPCRSPVDFQPSLTSPFLRNKTYTTRLCRTRSSETHQGSGISILGFGKKTQNIKGKKDCLGLLAWARA